MSIIGSNILAGASGSGVSAYEIEQSLRFNKADTPYLNKVFTSAGDEQKFTISFWFKTTNVGNSTASNLAGAGDDGSNYFLIDIEKASVGEFLHIFNYTPSTGYEFDLKTTRLLRDPSAWMHLVLAVDTTQATASDRAKVWLNGVRETSFATENYPNQNRTTMWWGGNTSNGIALANQETAIGRRPPGGPEYANAYIAEFNSIDGQYLTHEDFGEFDDNGVWRPIKYTGTYTGNSFYLKFDAADIDGDSSGLGNDFTANNFTTSGTGTDVMSDTPTTNWCTLNPLIVNNSTYVDPAGLSEGNLVASQSSVPYNAFCTGTFKLPSSGKWYWEVKQNAAPTAGVYMGIGRTPWDPTSDQSARGGMYAYKVNGDKYKLGTASSYGSSWTNGDIVGVAVDMDNTTISFYKNGTSQGNAFTDIDTAYDYVPMTWGDDPNRNIWVYNFGQRAFEYTVPSGYKALNTANLPAPDIADGSDYFNTVLWTGNATARDITTGHNSNFTWIKHRSSAENHNLYDILRGVGNRLESNSQDYEVNYTDRLTAFNSDGFSLGTGYNNTNSTTYVGWSWAGGGSGTSNSDGSINSTVSASPSSGFSIVTWTGSQADGTVGHGLGVAPSLIIFKRYNNNGTSWPVYHSAIGPSNFVQLNETTASGSSGTSFGSTATAPTSTVFSVGNNGGTNYGDMVAYCFAEVEGYSKFGSYTGNGSSDGPFVFLGFKPALVIWKRTSGSVYHWVMRDSTRDADNPTQQTLYPSTSGAEQTLTAQDVDYLSNGFKIKTTWDYINASGEPYIFMAWAENPFGGSGVSPATAR